MYYVYVLRNFDKNQIYVGSTRDLKKRIEQHNNGLEISTKRYQPWNLIYYEAFNEEKLARIREQKLKYNGNAMKELKKRIGLLGLPSTSSNVPKTGAGFTYVELLIALAVMGILITVTLIAINPSFQLKKARDANRKADLKLIQSGLELYKSDQGVYPDGTTVGTIITATNCPPLLTDDDACTPPYAKIYIQNIPTDPKTAKNYYFYAGTPVNGYTLYSCLENVNDPDKLPSDSTNPAYPNSTVRTALGCSVSAYYGVTSP